MSNIYYVYAYLDPRKEHNLFGFEPFYIGKGKGRRKNSHLTMDYHHPKCFKIKNIRKVGLEPVIIVIESDLSESDALVLESRMISEIGTVSPIAGIKSGPLTNLKLDGEIQKYSTESKTKMSESASKRIRPPHSPETIAKMKATYAAKTDEEKREWAARTSKLHKGKSAPSGQAERMSKLHKGKTISEAHRLAIIAFQTGRQRTSETCQRVSDCQKKTYEIEQESTGKIFVVSDLMEWSKSNFISYGIIFRTFSTGRFNKGYRINKKYGGTH